MASEALLTEYEQVASVLEARGEAVALELRALLASDPSLKVHSVSWRLKSPESLARKVSRPDRSYADLWTLTDLIGVRVITYFADAVDRVGELVEAKMPVDFAHSTDKRRRETTDFGYRSLHYVCRIGAPLPERACFEIQVRTVLEHAWAEIEHDLGYKASEEIPVVVRRRLNRLAGLLELADQEFGAIRSDLQTYARALPDQIEAADATVPLDGLSLVALLDRTEVQSLDGAISALLKRELDAEPFYPDYLLRMLVASGIRTIEQARSGIGRHERAITAMVKPYFALAEQLWQLTPTKMGRIPRGYSLFFLAHLEVLRSSTLRLEKVERLARLYRELDYPDDARAATDVATRLVDTFGAIDLEPIVP